MQEINVQRDLSAEALAELGVFDWPVWEKGVSRFDWSYDAQETCYLLEGEVTVTPEGGMAVRFGKGDLVTFPPGMRCVWDISAPVAKHYRID
jgi:uncharacterized cupin superfamily protein